MARSGRGKKCGHILVLGTLHMQNTVEVTFAWLSELEVRKDLTGAERAVFGRLWEGDRFSTWRQLSSMKGSPESESTH